MNVMRNRALRIMVAMVAMLGLSLGMAGSASANHQDFGVCHATGSATNPFVYISPDQSSGHINTDESPAGPSHEDDRVATEAERDARQCVGQTEFPTEVPPTEVPPTEVPPTDVPGEPTQEPTPTENVEPTDVPVGALPTTGSNPSDGNSQAILLLSAVAAMTLIGAAAVARRTRFG